MLLLISLIRNTGYLYVQINSPINKLFEVKMEQDLIPFREWCRLNNIGITTGYKLLNSQELHAVKVGKLTFIHRDESNRWAKSLPAYKAENQ